MNEIKNNKKDVLKVLEYVIDTYETSRSILKKTPIEAKADTLKKYDDFYEWLQLR